MVVRLDCEHTFTTALYGRILLNGKFFSFYLWKWDDTESLDAAASNGPIVPTTDDRGL